MVGFSTVGFALTVIVVLEFDSACWAVCDAHGLCSCEYLFSKLPVFSCACSAHRSSSSFLFVFLSRVGVRWWRVAASARRAPPPSNTTLLFFLSSPFFFSLSWIGVCCVVRAQPCEHARNTTHASCVCVCVRLMVCVLCATTTVFVAPTTHCSLLMATVLNIEHCVLLITL